MRKAILPTLLAAACLLVVPWAAGAQTTSATPAHSAPRSAPAADNAPQQPLAWSSLSAQQQHMLAPVQDQWSRMHPARQYRLAEHAQHWASLPPERQQQIRERLTRWTKMTPEQRRQLRENARAFHKLTPEQRAKVSAAFRKFQSLPPAQRKALRERWHAMPPAQRMRWATEHGDKPIPLHPPAHSGH